MTWGQLRAKLRPLLNVLYVLLAIAGMVGLIWTMTAGICGTWDLTSDTCQH